MTFKVSCELKHLVSTLAEWAEPATSATVYLYGSRVRGDHARDSDIDIAVDWGNPVDDATVDWWGFNNANEFSSINEKLPGPLQVLEPDDKEFHAKVRNGPFVYREGNIVCVLLRPKT